MIQLYNTLLFQPLLNLLIWLYNLVGDIGIAIILVTVLIRLILLIPSKKAIKSQKALQELQPKLEEIRKKYKDDKKKQNEEMMKFYQQNKINPLGSCLPMLVQLPILFAMYGVFMKGLKSPESLQMLYSFVARPEHINTMFLGILDMIKPNVVLAALAGVLQFVQSKMMMTKLKTKKTSSPASGLMGDMGGMMSKQMTYLMPVMTVFIGLSLPSGLALYWVITTLFAIIQQWAIMKKSKI